MKQKSRKPFFREEVHKLAPGCESLPGVEELNRHVQQPEVAEYSQSCSIFILSQDPAYGKSLQEWLEPLYSISIFADATRLQEELQTYPPDIILVDSGFAEKWLEEFCRELKASVQTNFIRLICLTERVGPQSPVTPVHSFLADACLERPCDLSHLKVEIDRQLLLGEYTDKAYYKLLQNRDVSPRRRRSNKDEEDTLFISKLCQLIHENIFRSNLTIGELSKEMGLCRSSLYNRVKAITNLPPRELIVNERIRMAKELLEEGTYLVGEIGLMVGISDLKYFGNFFKTRVGTTPSEYMHRCKKWKR